MGKFSDFVKSDGIFLDIEKETLNNDNFRKVLFTGKNMQLVLMSLKQGEDIGEEKHNVDQFFRVEGGTGEYVIEGTKHNLQDGSAFVIPANKKHNVINTGKEDLKIYTIYSPPHHEDGVIVKNKGDIHGAR